MTAAAPVLAVGGGGRALTAVEVRETVKRAGIELVNYRQL